MVSLGDESRRSGGFFFDNPSQQTTESDELLADPSSVRNQDEASFRKIHTVWTIVVMILLIISLEAAAFALPYGCGDKCGDVSVTSILVYCQAGIWFPLLLCDRVLRHQHYVSRLNGYLNFYSKTKNIRRMPLMIFSGGNALFIIMATLLRDNCQKEPCGKGTTLKKSNYLQIMISLEVAVALVGLLVYLVWTVKFNNRRPSPDVNEEDYIPPFLHTRTRTTDIGFRDDSYLDEVLEKQADMIRYLKQHNAQLGRKIIQLNTARDNPS